MSVVPLLALARSWEVAALLIVLERVGKAIRDPPRDAMLAHAARQMGYGWGFGVHERWISSGRCSGRCWWRSCWPSQTTTTGRRSRLWRSRRRSCSRCSGSRGCSTRARRTSKPAPRADGLT